MEGGAGPQQELMRLGSDWIRVMSRRASGSWCWPWCGPELGEPAGHGSADRSFGVIWELVVPQGGRSTVCEWGKKAGGKAVEPCEP